MKPQDATIGKRVMAMRAFNGVPRFSEGTVDEYYSGGVMVAWDHSVGVITPGLRDGFSHEEIERYLGNAPKDDAAREKVRVLLTFMQDVTEKGYSGMARGGMLVDRREHPDAIPVPANTMMGIPRPKCLPCRGSGKSDRCEGSTVILSRCTKCDGTGYWIDPNE